jgi:hypothetical protein
MAAYDIHDAFFVGPNGFSALDGTENPLDAILTNENPRVRSYGRLLATDMMEIFRKWLIGEVDRKTSPMDVLSVITSFYTDLAVSVSNQSKFKNLSPEELKILIAALADLVVKDLEMKFTSAQALLADLDDLAKAKQKANID